MAEITITDAAKMDADDARCLLNWRDHTHANLVAGLAMQQLLDLYHASAAYMTLESWLDYDPKAEKLYARIRRLPRDL